MLINKDRNAIFNKGELRYSNLYFIKIICDITKFNELGFMISFVVSMCCILQGKKLRHVTHNVIRYVINIYLDPKIISIFLENNINDTKFAINSKLFTGDERHIFIL